MVLLNKPALAALTICSLAATSQAQIKAVLYDKKGKETGAVVMNAALKPSGNLVLSMDLKGSSGHLQLSETFAPSGMPIEQIANGTQGDIKVTINLHYGSTSLSTITTVAGKTNSQNFPYPKGANMKERNNLWFISGHPKVGTVDAYTDFDIATKAWKAKTTKYVGDEKIKYHGKLVSAHKILATDETSWVDDRGLPYRSINSKNGELLVRQ